MKKNNKNLEIQKWGKNKTGPKSKNSWCSNLSGIKNPVAVLHQLRACLRLVSSLQKSTINILKNSCFLAVATNLCYQEVAICLPKIPANFCYQETFDWHKWTKGLGFDCSVIIWLSMTLETQVQLTLDKKLSYLHPINVPATPTLPHANLHSCYREALNWHKWTKEDAISLIFSAVLIELSCIPVLDAAQGPQALSDHCIFFLYHFHTFLYTP